MNPNDPAFPVRDTKLEDQTEFRYPLTKREYLAGLAMQGFCNDTSFEYSTGPCNSALAERAVLIADALIEALNGK